MNSESLWMMRSETVIIELLSEKMLINVLINFLTKSAVIKFILSVTSALKMYYLSFEIRKTAAEVLKCDFSHIKLLCWFKIMILFIINVILALKWVYIN